MARQELQNGATMGVQRQKINEMTEEIYEKIGACAYIRGDSIACATAGQYYPLTGTFTNKSLENFVVNGDAIEYTGSNDFDANIFLYVSTASDKQGSILTFAVLKNGTEITGSDRSREFSTGTVGSLSNAICEPITNGDLIAIAVKSDTANTNVSLLDINTLLKKAYT